MPWIIGILLAAVITTGVMVQQQGDPAPATSNQTVLDNTNFASADNVESQPDVASAPGPHPVSLPALFSYAPTGRDLTLGQVLDDNSSYTRYYLTYKSDDLTISGILNIPKGTGPFPVLFLNHGHIDQSVYTNGRGLRREQEYLARQGFAVLHSDYRCHAESDCPVGDRLTERLGYVTDVINAVTAVKNSGDPRLSTTAFGMLGHSMGGGITQRLAVAQPNLISAAVLYAPVSMDEIESFNRYTARRPDDAQKVITTYGSPTHQPEFWNNLSAKTFLDRLAIPTLYFQGTSDTSVEPEWTDQSVAMLKAAGKDVEYVVYPGQPHEFTTEWGDFMRRAAAFFQNRLTE